MSTSTAAPWHRAEMRYGGDYNPEQWAPEVWRDDIALMQRAGVNLVSVGIFSWSAINPEPGVWQFEWLDEVLGLLHEAGIDVDLATPTASPPPWFCLEHPDALFVDDRGVRTHHGARNHYCPSSATYRAACRELADVLGRRYGSHPAVVMWHIGNEYGPQCFCDSCAVDFRAWLADRHGTIDDLNSDWGTAFWSQRYRSFDEVLPPRTAPYHHNPSHLLDFRRHGSHQLLRLFTEQRDVLRGLVGDTPITTNFMGIFSGADGWAWAREVDVVADDHYINPGNGEFGRARAALVHDLMRSQRDEPWLMMEQAMGAVNWRQHNVPKTDSQRRHDVLRAVAHGADGVLSFQWRASRHGVERFHSAMVPHAGADTRYFRAVESIGVDLARLAPVVGHHQPSRVAMLLDWDSLWLSFDPALPSHRDLVEVLDAWYLPLWRAGVPVDFRHPSDDLSGYDVVLAPATHAVTDDQIANLRAHVTSGRALVLGPFTLVSDEHGAVRPAPFPAGLADLLGASVDQFWPLPDEGLAVTGEGIDATATVWAEQLSVTDAEVLVRAVDHTDLDAVVVRAAAGSGHDLTLVSADLPETALASVLSEVLARRGVAPALGHVTGTEGCEVTQRGPVTFVLNPARHEVVLGLTGPVTNLLDESQHHESITVPAGGAVALISPEGGAKAPSAPETPEAETAPEAVTAMEEA